MTGKSPFRCGFWCGLVLLHGLCLMCLPLLLVGCGESTKPVPEAVAKGNSSARTTETAGKDSQPPTLARFRGATSESGVAFTYRDGQEAAHFAILESLGGGVALFDYDGDSKLDLFFPGGGGFGEGTEIRGRTPSFYRNAGGLKFLDVTRSAGVAEAPYYSHGVAVGDCNNDGFPDLLVTGYGGLLLFENCGDGMFIEVAKARGLTDQLWSSSAGWGDLNGDGALDLYVAHYVDWSFDNNPVCGGRTLDERDVCPPKRYHGLPHVLYYGVGDGTFRDVSREAGLEPNGPLGKGLGVLLADVDVDGKLDIYVANDTVANFLYHNLGEGKFSERGNESGTALSDMATPDGSMGVDFTDFNGDGLPDIWVANYERESLALYRNEGNCQFLHVSRMTGVTAVGSLYVSFGTLFLDFDRDGDEDIFVTNGHVLRFPANAPVKQLPLLFENRSGRFYDVAPQAGECLREPHLGRGVAGGDVDSDGDIDLVLTPINEPAEILLNESPNRNHWLRVRLIGTRSHRDAVGARLTLETTAGRQTRQIKGGGSYLSQNDMAAFFGIPEGATIEKLTIDWPAGTHEERVALEMDRTAVIVER